MRSLSNRLLIIMVAGLVPVLTVQVITLAQANGTGLILIGVGNLLSLALTALLGTRLIRRPIIQLLGAAEHWRMGDLTARTGLLKDSSEFGRLAAAFDAMVATLDARQQALRNAIESTTDAVFVMDRAWRYTYRNARAKEVFSDGRDLIGKVLWDVFPGHAETIFGKAYRKAMETGVPTHVHGYYAPRNAWWEARAYPSKDGLTVFCRDVAEETNAVTVLRDSEERLRVALAAARMGVRETDMVTGDSQWTPEAARILGRDYLGDTSLDAWFAAIHPDDQAHVRANWDRVRCSPDVDFEAEYRFRQPDGSWRWIGAYSRVMFEAGSAIRAICVVQDISARKHVEEALRESETRLQLAHEAAGFGVWDWDFHAKTHTWSDDQWRLYGLEPKPDGLSFAAWGATIHPEDRDRVLADWAADSAGNIDRISYQFRVVWPGGSIRWLLGKGAIIRDSLRRVVRVVGVTLDVTASAQTEAELRRLGADLEMRVQQEVAAREAAQMRAAHAERMQALGQLAGGIAHDFNNVLQLVLGAITLIARRPDDQAGIPRLTQLAGEAIERGSSITRRLLAFGRRGDLRSEAIDAAMLLNGLREILVHTLGTSIDIRVSVEPGLPPFFADKSQLETALINVATNARDAMPGGGKLVLSAATEIVPRNASAHPARLDRGSYMRLTITDTGVGMDAATLARAIEPFFTTKEVGAGTGLGLAMCKGFAEQSGGGMSVESRPDHGTTVTLWLPEASSETATSIGAALQAPGNTAISGNGNRATPIRILLVEDDSQLREILAMNLEDAGHSVLPAASGPEALALLAAGEIVEALVTDLSMPGMDGLTLIRAVQERRPGLAAVLLTGYVDDGVALAVNGALSGTFSLLRKPATSLQIVDRLGALLAARSESTR